MNLYRNVRKGVKGVKGVNVYIAETFPFMTGEGTMKRWAVVAVMVVCVFWTTSGVSKDAPQPFPRDAAGKIVFQGVVLVDGVAATDLYSRAKLWAARSFRSAKDVIQLDDPTNGRLVCKGFHEEPFGWGAGASIKVWFTFTVEVKDGRYRWTIDQVAEGATGPDYPLEKYLNAEGVGIVGRKAVYERCRLALIAFGDSLAAAEKTAPPAKDF